MPNPTNLTINDIPIILNTPEPFKHVGIYSSIADCDIFNDGI